MIEKAVTLLTGNDLLSGDVLWWTGHGWSRHLAEAAPAGAHPAALAASEELAGRVVGAYAIEADALADGTLRPRHIKERIRASGPTVRPDLGIKPLDPAWLI